MSNLIQTVPTRIRIAGLCGLINGIQTAFTQIPRMVQDAQLPAMVIIPGPATYDYAVESAQILTETRVYQLVLLVQNAAFGTSGDDQLQADPFFNAVRDYFAARPGLELDTQAEPRIPAVLDAKLLGDGGLGIGPYPLGGGGPDTPNYVQIRWQLQVRELAPIYYRD